MGGSLRRELGGIALLLFAVFLYQVAHDSLPAVWMFYVQEKFGWGPSDDDDAIRAMRHAIERGVVEPEATFSTCFGATSGQKARVISP